MLKADDRPKFVSAMENEISGLKDMLEIVPRSTLPKGTLVLPAIWAFKHKRLPDWTILKHKARLNVHGGKQTQGVNYWETYAPVVNWSIVCLTMILSLLKGFKCRQVDFVQAFTQAPLDCPIFMEIPAGYSVVNGKLQFTGGQNCQKDNTHVIKLLKNMYGLKQAGHNWYNSLTDHPLKSGFKQSQVDKYLFIRDNCIIVVYVDDYLLFSPTDDVLERMIKNLCQVFTITTTSSSETYLGLDVSRHDNGTIILHQPGLIDKVITICGLENESNTHLTPAVTILQKSEASNEPRLHRWSYHQVIGILNYIAATTHLDITFVCGSPVRQIQRRSKMSS
jgi:hypothetical protein